MQYLGTLPTQDPLFHYLRKQILPQFGLKGISPEFQVYKIETSNRVYVYRERHNDVRIIGKFFGKGQSLSPEIARQRMEREFNGLNYLRDIGFSGYPHHVARPLGCKANLNYVLIEEFCDGTSLADVILDAIFHKNEKTLRKKLTALAYFLATMHNQTANEFKVDFNKVCSYFDRLIEQLQAAKYTGIKTAKKLTRHKERWMRKSCMWQDLQVVVHGDITPSNIVFGRELAVFVFDLERLKLADRVFDVGRLAGEIKHFFMQYAENKEMAEPFIRHFLWEYACHFPDRQSAFDSITRRVPFYMGMTLLRIARNVWVSNNYRKQLICEAALTLR